MSSKSVNRLRQNAIDRALQEALAVADGHDDADGRRSHFKSPGLMGRRALGENLFAATHETLLMRTLSNFKSVPK